MLSLNRTNDERLRALLADAKALGADVALTTTEAVGGTEATRSATVTWQTHSQTGRALAH